MDPQQIEVLGAQIVRELSSPVVGAGPTLDAGFGINTAAELLNRGVNTYQAQEDAKKSAAAQAAGLAKAISADVSWANAEVMFTQAQQSKDSQKIAAAQSIAGSAQAAAMSAGAGLNADSQAKRQQAANDMARQAAEKSFAQPGNAGLAAAMNAWQKVAAAISSGMGSGGGMVPYRGGGGGGFMEAMGKRYGGIPLGGWLIGTPIVGFGLWKLFKAIRRK